MRLEIVEKKTEVVTFEELEYGEIFRMVSGSSIWMKINMDGKAVCLDDGGIGNVDYDSGVIRKEGKLLVN